MNRSANEILQLSEKQLDTVYRQVLEPQLAELEPQRERANSLRQIGIVSIVWMLAEFVIAAWLDGFKASITYLRAGLVIAMFLLLMIVAIRESLKKNQYGDDSTNIHAGIALISLLLSTGFFLFGQREIALFLAGFSMLGVDALLIWSVNVYQNAYKDVVMPQLLKHAGTDLNYIAAPKFSTKMLNECGLLNRPVSSLKAEDGIMGYWGDRAIMIAEVEAKQNKETLFKGLFGSVELPQKFDGWLRIYPKRNVVGDGSVTGNVYTYFGSDKFESADRLQIDDEEFNSRFRVYASSPAAAHALLTPKLMEKLIAQSPQSRGAMKNFATSITLSIANNRVYVAVPTTGNFLEPRASNPATDRKMLEQKVQELEMMLSIIEDLNIEYS